MTESMSSIIHILFIRGFEFYEDLSSYLQPHSVSGYSVGIFFLFDSNDTEEIVRLWNSLVVMFFSFVVI